MAGIWKSSAILLFVSLTFWLATTSDATSLRTGSEKENTESQEEISTETEDKSSDGADADTRIGINFNRGHAHAFGPGGFGSSDSATWGFNAGIQHANQQYQPIANQAGGYSNNFNSGPNAPHTFSNSRTNNRPGYAGGNTVSGFNGGIGNAIANNAAMNYRIPLGNGAVLLSNLKTSKTETEVK